MELYSTLIKGHAWFLNDIFQCDVYDSSESQSEATDLNDPRKFSLESSLDKLDKEAQMLCRESLRLWQNPRIPEKPVDEVFLSVGPAPSEEEIAACETTKIIWLREKMRGLDIKIEGDI
jgi:hypothetical protein